MEVLMIVEFTQDEKNKIPVRFHSLMQQYPNSFHNLLDAIVTPWRSPVEFESIEIYFDDEYQPALAFHNGKCRASDATDDPTIISVYGNDELLLMEICNQSILKRKELSEIKVFQVCNE
jgi:hypothetical protein